MIQAPRPVGCMTDSPKRSGAQTYLWTWTTSQQGSTLWTICLARSLRATFSLAVIGPNWLDAKDSDGRRRLDNPDDFVTIEISAALLRNIRVIPVLVDGARPPKADQLPD